MQTVRGSTYWMTVDAAWDVSWAEVSWIDSDPHWDTTWCVTWCEERQWQFDTLIGLLEGSFND